jgi:thioester reductase-like protein
MTILLTGSTGFLGSYVAAHLLTHHADRLALLVRARTVEEAQKRLWRSLQLHLDFESFYGFLKDRIDIYCGDIVEPSLGLDPELRDRLVHSLDSIIHCAASLNRKSDKACLNVNLRGTLEMIKIARAAQDHHGLRRFSEVSTVAVAGRRQDEVVQEDSAVEWDRSDYDPYARTKKFCEHMLAELLPEVPRTVFRPSIILGDSRFPETTQFDMVRAFSILARLPVLPLRPDWRIDIVPADFVGRAVATMHQKEKPSHEIYHLSSGEHSLTYRQVVDALVAKGHPVHPFFAPSLNRPFESLVNRLMGTPRSWKISLPASLLKVFLPYLTYNTVFANERIVEEMRESPRPFSEYAYDLLRFVRKNNFQYPYKEWPVDHRDSRVA